MILWVKKNWPLLAVALVVLYFWNSSGSPRLPISGGGSSSQSFQYDSRDSKGIVAPAMPSFNSRQVAPSESDSRLVIQNSSLSLQVKDVPVAIAEVEKTAVAMGGFLVNSNLSKPEGAASGHITVRIPEAQRAAAMAAFKGLAVKVVSESVLGTDVTDQYVDLASQLEILLKTKQKYEDILDRATAVNDLLNVQQQLVNLQNQIDRVRGQQKYYEQSAKLSLVDVYLSTDDLALPYAPTNGWRPLVVVKEAVRSLINSVRGLINLAIWIGVYSPLILIAWIIYRWWKNKNQNPIK